jgi:stage II sporulation protein R
MTDKVKLGLVFGAIVIAFIIQLIVGSPVDANGGDVSEGGGLRLRVIAHSDDSFDQVVKRVVVFAVEDFLNQHDDGHSVNFIINNFDGIRNTIDQVLTEINVKMGVEISLEHHYFSDSLAYYASLVVRLGDGQGANWWCFINPGVCTVPNEADVSANEAQVVMTDELQDHFGARTIRFVGRLFGGESDRREVAVGEIDWFLFDDERQ